MTVKENVIKMINEVKQEGSCYTATAGFDVVIDAITRVIRKSNVEGRPVYFQTIEEFGNYLVSKKNMSCSIEMETQQEKIGGNMAIFAHALGTLGVHVHCVGSLGYPEISTAFQQMHSNCELHTVCQNGHCNALEFNDGKVMLSSLTSLQEISWEIIEERLNRESMEQYFGDSELVSLLNWSELIGSTKLFTKIYENCIRPKGVDKDKKVLLDLSDASRKSEEELLEVLALGERYAKYRTVIMSMNENEGRLMYRALFGEDGKDCEEIICRIGERLEIDYLVLHLTNAAYGYYQGVCLHEDGYYTATPKLSTGGGDNFNAGLCFGLMRREELATCLQLGNAVSGCYVRTGESPTLETVEKFIKQERG